MKKPLLQVDVDAFVTSLLSWNDAENVGRFVFAGFSNNVALFVHCPSHAVTGTGNRN